MKSKDIVVGGTYINSKGVIREVTNQGPQFKGFGHQSDLDCIAWSGLTRTGNMTRNSFAKWASERIDKSEDK